MDLINLSLIFPDKNYIKLLGSVTNPQIYMSNNKTIHPEGLYSPTIFGPHGSETRMTKHGYIDLHVDMVHPIIYSTVVSLSIEYKKIIESSKYVIFDEKLKVFLDSDMVNGFTGYEYFFKHINKLKFNRTESKTRDEKIKLVEKYLKIGNIRSRYFLILPAGIREFTIDENKRVNEDDIADLYRGVMNTASFLNNFTTTDLGSLDHVRIRLQNKMNDVYDYLLSLIEGKKKLLNYHWAARGIDYGTRNVLSGASINIPDLTEADKGELDYSYCGLYQYVKSIEPITKTAITTKFISNVFKAGENSATVIDHKTMLSTRVEILPKYRDQWVTLEGLDSLLNKLLDDDVKNSPITIGKDYFGIVSEVGDIITYYTHSDFIPDDIDKKSLRPITYGEMFYISIYDRIDLYPGLVTRYPVTGEDSIYTTKLKVYTTTTAKTVRYRHVSELGVKETTIKNYPITDMPWNNAMNVFYGKLQGLGGDYDGFPCFN